MDCMKSGSGQLAAQFHESLRTIRSQVVRAREAISILPQWKLPPNHLLTQAQLDLTYTEDLVNDLLLDGVNAPYTRPQKPLASSSNVVNWATCISTGSPEQHSWLGAGAQTGGRSWVEPGHGTASATDNNPFKSNKTNISDRAFLFAGQCAMGLEPVGMPKVNLCQKTQPTPCRNPTINPTVPRDHAKSGVLHAASHFELFNRYIHKPVVIALFNCFRLHGFNVTYGDLGSEFYNGRRHKHSADLSVEAWYGPNRHLRIDVKSACDYGITNRRRPGGIEAHLKLMEVMCRAQHGTSEVLPFAITTSGGMGRDAINLIKKLGERGVGMVQVTNEMQLNWLVPSHGKYWHRRLRGLAIVGWYNTYRECMGLAYTEDQFAGRGDITVKDAMRLRGVLEGEQHCPLCGSEQDDCMCICRPANFSDGCGGRCALGRTWPPCVSCSTCGSCCRCIDNPQLQQHQPISQSAAPGPASEARMPSAQVQNITEEQYTATVFAAPSEMEQPQHQATHGQQPSGVGQRAPSGIPMQQTSGMVMQQPPMVQLQEQTLNAEAWQSSALEAGQPSALETEQTRNADSEQPPVVAEEQPPNEEQSSNAQAEQPSAFRTGQRQTPGAQLSLNFDQQMRNLQHAETFIEQHNISTNAVIAEAPSALGTDVEMQMTQRVDSEVRYHPDAQGSEVRGRRTRETNTRERD